MTARSVVIFVGPSEPPLLTTSAARALLRLVVGVHERRFPADGQVGARGVGRVLA